MHSKSAYLLIIIGLMGLIVSACNFNEEKDVKTIHGSGNVISETREVSDFYWVDVIGNGTVTISVTGEETLRIEAEDNIMEVLTSDVKDGTLRLGPKENVNLDPTHEISYYLTVKTLEAVKLVGNGHVEVEGVDTETVVVELTGNGFITLAGQVAEIRIDLTGSGDVKAFDLTSSRATVDLSGNGNVEVNASAQLDVLLTGNGSVRYDGNPQVNSSVTGNGAISRR